MTINDLFGEFYEDDGTTKNHLENLARSRKRRKAQDKANEVGLQPEPSPEMLKKREIYKKDFILLHKEVFPDSTGIRPFGEKQKKSIEFGRDVFDHGGRLLRLEPRGYAKTTRITNESLAAVLLGMQSYIVIICSNQDKATELLDSLKTELLNNDRLIDLFPGPMACFRHLDGNPHRADYQTIEGERTYIRWGTKTLRFPYYPGEVSSGKFIEVRPITNLKGLHKKLKTGPDAGKVVRPTLYLLDDPQTHEEAFSETSVRKIISYIKRDALRGGSHSKRASAIMSITPVTAGDVAWHFEKNEQSWDLIRYKMLEKYPEEHDWWMNVYSKVYLNYDREVRGDRIRAALEARKLVEENYERVHKGAEVTWEHAYAWDEEPQTEISAVQHAYNIILDDGWEDFEFECQCNTEYGEYDSGETLNAPRKQILHKVLPYKRNVVPQQTSKIVCHIDVNKEVLTYSIACSPKYLRPHFVDYGEFPKQPGLFSKTKLIMPLSRVYSQYTDYRDVLYKGVIDLIQSLATRQFIREDGVTMTLSRIGVDIRYEETYVSRAIRESNYRNIVRPCAGVYVGPDDPALHTKQKESILQVWENCYLEPNKSKTLDVLNVDANYFKSELHKGFNLDFGMPGSCTLFGIEDDGTPVSPDRHVPFADHLNGEKPQRITGLKKQKTKVVWKERRSQVDNEWLDNSANCIALLISEGVDPSGQISPQKTKRKGEDMRDFINSQQGTSLL